MIVAQDVSLNRFFAVVYEQVEKSFSPCATASSFQPKSEESLLAQCPKFGVVLLCVAFEAKQRLHDSDSR